MQNNGVYLIIIFTSDNIYYVKSKPENNGLCIAFINFLATSILIT